MYDERNLLWRRVKSDVLPAGLRTIEYFTHDGNRNVRTYAWTPSSADIFAVPQTLARRLGPHDAGP